jgi:hypothetical protein
MLATLLETVFRPVWAVCRPVTAADIIELSDMG